MAQTRGCCSRATHNHLWWNILEETIVGKERYYKGAVMWSFINKTQEGGSFVVSENFSDPFVCILPTILETNNFKLEFGDNYTLLPISNDNIGINTMTHIFTQ